MNCARQTSTAPEPRGRRSGDRPKSTATHHFRVLREAGVIHQSPTGTTKLTMLRRDDLDARLPGLLDAVLGAPAAALTASMR